MFKNRSFRFTLFVCSLLFWVDSRAMKPEQSTKNLINQQLVDVISISQDGKVYKISLELDQKGNIHHLRKSPHEDKEQCQFPLKDFLGQFIVLSKEDNIDVLKLKYLPRSTTTKNSFLQLSYLHNGITGRYEKIQMIFEYSTTEKKWQLLTQKERKVVKSLSIFPRTWLGKTFGVDKISVTT